MAYLPSKVKEEIINSGLRELTANTITDPNKLLGDLIEIKKNGWSHTVGEFTDEVVGVSIPVFDHNRKIFGSLTIAAPSYRVSDTRVVEFLELLREYALKIQERIQTFRLKSTT